MENTSPNSYVLNNVTIDDDLARYAAQIRNVELKAIYILIGTLGVIDNLFVIIVFALFIRITDKV